MRLSKTIKSDAVDFEIAVAALRPPQRASATPDGQAGVKLSFNHLKGWRTKGAADTGTDAAGGLVCPSSVVDSPSTNSPRLHRVRSCVTATFLIDALLPIVPATKECHANALTLTGSFVSGAGIADQYNGLNFGVANPSLPNPGMATPAPAYTTNIDNGLALFAKDSAGKFQLHPIQVQC